MIADVRDRGRVPVLVGGSALYTRAVLDRFEFPGTDDAVRSRLEAELAEVGAPALHRRLQEVDPVAASSILVDNGRRIVRALEVLEITGRPFSATLPAPRVRRPAQRPDRRRHRPADPRPPDRAAGRRDVRGRVRRGGASACSAAGLREGRTAASAIGYREVTAYLDGDLTLDEARERTVVATRRFARRQDSWFRKDPRIDWVRYDDPERVEQALAAVGPFRGG